MCGKRQRVNRNFEVVAQPRTGAASEAVERAMFALAWSRKAPAKGGLNLRVPQTVAMMALQNLRPDPPRLPAPASER